jgi:UDP-N-acetylglucosamine 2-epimerase (non-hydrolysing)
MSEDPRRKVLTLFGTRPEVIKLAPVIRALEERERRFRVVNVTSAQHMDLLYPFVRYFNLQVHHDLQVMEDDQTPNRVCARVLDALDPVLLQEQPDLVLVQGDTSTALAGALASFHRGVPVAHVEAGLRTANPASPFPEEMNRRLITRLARLHFAATPRNVETLRREGVPDAHTVLTGNPVVDALDSVLIDPRPSPEIEALLGELRGKKLAVLTTHRRESFGDVMAANLAVLRAFIERHADTALVFPVHPNPSVRGPAEAILAGAARCHLLDPLDYFDFVHLLSQAWLIVTDSGGVQEESPTLGVPVLVIRENTERPEGIEAGVARLVGGSPQRLAAMLEDVLADDSWRAEIGRTANPFGRGDSGERIAAAIEAFFAS